MNDKIKVLNTIKNGVSPKDSEGVREVLEQLEEYTRGDCIKGICVILEMADGEPKMFYHGKPYTLVGLLESFKHLFINLECLKEGE